MLVNAFSTRPSDDEEGGQNKRERKKTNGYCCRYAEFKMAESIGLRHLIYQSMFSKYTHYKTGNKTSEVENKHLECFLYFFVLVTARWSGDEFSFDQFLDARSITFHEPRKLQPPVRRPLSPFFEPFVPNDKTLSSSLLFSSPFIIIYYRMFIIDSDRKVFNSVSPLGKRKQEPMREAITANEV